MLVGDIDRHVTGKLWCWSSSWFDRYAVDGSRMASNDSGSCAGDMGVN